MGTTDVALANQALGLIASGRIASLDDGSEPARAFNAVYAALRDEVLASYPWTFARARMSLSLDSATPDFGFTYQYILPADFLRIVEVNGDTIPASDSTGNIKRNYSIEGNKFLTDLEEVNMIYIKQVTDAALFTAPFVSCLASRIATDLAMSIAKNPRLSLEMLKVYEMKRQEFASTDSQNDREFYYHPTSSYESAR